MLGQIKPRKRRRSKITWGEPFVFNPMDGLELNDLVAGRRMSRKTLQFNSHDFGQYVKIDHRYYRDISAMRLVMRVNRYKSFNINSKNVILNRKANDGD